MNVELLRTSYLTGAFTWNSSTYTPLYNGFTNFHIIFSYTIIHFNKLKYILIKKT